MTAECTPSAPCRSDGCPYCDWPFTDIVETTIWAPATDGEFDAWGRGYDAGWNQGYRDGREVA